MSQALENQALAPVIEPVETNDRRDATVEAINGDRALRILLPSYRSNPTTGGQGVYMRHISKAVSYTHLTLPTKA